MSVYRYSRATYIRKIKPKTNKNKVWADSDMSVGWDFNSRDASIVFEEFCYLVQNKESRFPHLKGGAPCRPTRLTGWMRVVHWHRITHSFVPRVREPSPWRSQHVHPGLELSPRDVCGERERSSAVSRCLALVLSFFLSHTTVTRGKVGRADIVSNYGYSTWRTVRPVSTRYITRKTCLRVEIRTDSPRFSMSYGQALYSCVRERKRDLWWNPAISSLTCPCYYF